MNTVKYRSAIGHDTNIRIGGFRFSMFGESMCPEFNPGELVAAVWQEPDVIIWGESYFIQASEELKNMKIVRRLFPHADNDKIILKAINPMFCDLVWPVSFVESVAMIKGIAV